MRLVFNVEVGEDTQPQCIDAWPHFTDFMKVSKSSASDNF